MAKKNSVLQSNASYEWKMARIIGLAISDGQTKAVNLELIPVSLIEGAAFRVADRPVPLPLMSMLKNLWCCCLNAVLCHSLPLLLHSLPRVCGSSHWGAQSAACIFRCFFFAEGPAWPITNNPHDHCLFCFVSIYILKVVQKDEFLWLFDVSVNGDMLQETEAW